MKLALNTIGFLILIALAWGAIYIIGDFIENARGVLQ